MTECVKSQQDQSTTEKKTESEKETNVREAGLHGDLVPKNPIGKLSDEAFMTGTLIRDPAQEDEPPPPKTQQPDSGSAVRPCVPQHHRWSRM